MTLSRIATLAGTAMALLCAAVPSTAAAGGLAISPATIEREAKPGSIGSVRVTNGASKTLRITVSARPWIQSRNGAVRPNDTRRLSQIKLGVTAFTLAPGQVRSVPASLLSRPSSGSLYGTISVIGTVVGASSSNGVTARYRLLAGLRLNPSTARRSLRAVVGSARYSGGTTRIGVRNAGNTVEPISGSATVSGPSGTRRVSITAQRIVPGATVDLRLPHGRLQAGRYTIALRLDQGGRRVATVTRSVRVR
ncbi:MAG: hypothetical protein QM679_11980 [Patulibacter sp.]